MEFSPQRILDVSESNQAPMKAILEYVFNSTYVSVYIHKLNTVAKMHMVHLYSPNSKEDPDLYE